MMLDIVIVAYRSDRFLGRLYEDLEELMTISCSLRVHDNEREQRNLATLKNELAAKGSGDYILFANADIIVSPGWDLRLVRVMEKYPEVGAVLPLPVGDLRYSHLWVTDVPEGHSLAKGFPTREEMLKIADRLSGNDSFHVYDEKFWSPFFAVLMSRKTWRDSNGFDERFRFWGSDREYHDRLNKRGLAVIGLRSCAFYHQGPSAEPLARVGGAIDTREEWNHRYRVKRKLESGEFPRWDLLSDEERRSLRHDAKYSHICTT